MHLVSLDIVKTIIDIDIIVVNLNDNDWLMSALMELFLQHDSTACASAQ